MAVEVVIYFTTGQYQATPWDHAANENISEWPPSPWRLLRSLIATWHTRCPEIPEPEFDEIITALAAEAPSYLLPAAKPSHTRHYLPDIKHRSDQNGNTSLQFAPRLNLDVTTPIRVLWPAVLSSSQRQHLAALLDKLTYLGRSESSCRAALVDSDSISTPNENWTIPHPAGDIDVLSPMSDVTRAQLEISPDQMRRGRRTKLPAGAQWVRYNVADEPATPPKRNTRQMPTTVRWLLHNPAPFLDTDGVLATHGLRGAVLGARKNHDQIRTNVPDSWLIAGPHQDDKISNQHRHAHWLWLANRNQVTELVLWVPDGIPEKLLYQVISTKRLPRFGYAPKGYIGGAELHLQAMGYTDLVLPDLVSETALRWRSVTPMLADRHPKRNRDRRLFAQREVERELAFRWDDQTPEVKVTLVSDWESHDVVSYRRYRWNENMAQRRRGMFLELELAKPLPRQENGLAVLSLGALNHFGFGLFKPITD